MSYYRDRKDCLVLVVTLMIESVMPKVIRDVFF